MLSLMVAIPSSLFLLAIFQHLRWRRLAIIAAQHNASLATPYPTLDPLFASDFFLTQAVVFLTNEGLEVAAHGFKRLQRLTWAVRCFGGLQSIETADPVNIRAVWTDRSGTWGVAPGRLTQMEPFCGQGFVNADGEALERSRGLVKLGLRRERVMTSINIFESALQRFFEQLPKDGATVDLQPLFRKLFLDTAMEFLFGEPAGAISGTTETETEDFVSAFRTGVLGCGLRIILGPIGSFVARCMGFGHACATTRAYIESRIDRAAMQQLHWPRKPSSAGEQQEEKHEQDDENSTQRRRTLAQLIAGQSVSRNVMGDTLIVSLMASLDTTAGLLGNTMFLLARDPHTYAAFRAEVLDAVGAHSVAADVGLGAATLQSLPVLRTIINESLRLYPVFPIMNRTALKDTVLPQGGGPNRDEQIFVPKGTVVNAHWHVMHRLPGAWSSSGDQASKGKLLEDCEKNAGDKNNDMPLEEFHPRRWLGFSPSAVPYMPFGIGHKRCIGQEKALLEAACALVWFARRYERIESRDARKWQGRVTLSAVNANGCLVGLIPAARE